jgi:hypothetical protein
MLSIDISNVGDEVRYCFLAALFAKTPPTQVLVMPRCVGFLADPDKKSNLIPFLVSRENLFAAWR